MTTDDVALITRGIVTPVREFVTNLFSSTTKRIEALEHRIATLEARPEITYSGVYDVERAYRAGETVTMNGSMWIAMKHAPGALPGPDWRLCVKKGRDAKRWSDPNA